MQKANSCGEPTHELCEARTTMQAPDDDCANVFETVATLISSGADLKALDSMCEGSTLLAAFCSNGLDTCVAALCGRKEIDLNELAPNGLTALSIAAGSGNHLCVRALLKRRGRRRRGADIDVQDACGRTALMASRTRGVVGNI